MPPAGRAALRVRGGRVKRTMFTAYLAFTLIGLAYLIVVGLLRL